MTQVVQFLPSKRGPEFKLQYYPLQKKKKN
jgi:hypothetical protein